MNVPWFVYPLTFEEHTGCFQFGAIVNKAAIHIHLQILSGPKLPSQLSKYLGM